MADAAGSSEPHERSRSHIPTFSGGHPMIPKLYVMPWKQDMKNQRLLMKVQQLCGDDQTALSNLWTDQSFTTNTSHTRV
ncbi:uncharacterized protein LOC125012694 isoform X2 [Mugil cephalus]|uniref:uncharacterized protein LOC125012694 isoform X2 n=1 Tax=Mugil cephalus TaxID=48193 RepID=UPI001FB63BD1|nr:uncharacterized protein LOC125012694 isoform X2 [Mugil cephalus]